LSRKVDEGKPLPGDRSETTGSPPPRQGRAAHYQYSVNPHPHTLHMVYPRTCRYWMPVPEGELGLQLTTCVPLHHDSFKPHPHGLFMVYPCTSSVTYYAPAASSFLSCPLSPQLFAQRVPVNPYTLAASSSLAWPLSDISVVSPVRRLLISLMVEQCARTHAPRRYKALHTRKHKHLCQLVLKAFARAPP